MSDLASVALSCSSTISRKIFVSRRSLTCNQCANQRFGVGAVPTCIGILIPSMHPPKQIGVLGVLSFSAPPTDARQDRELASACPEATGLSFLVETFTLPSQRVHLIALGLILAQERLGAKFEHGFCTHGEYRASMICKDSAMLLERCFPTVSITVENGEIASSLRSSQ